MARYTATPPATEHNRLDQELRPESLLFYSQILSELIIARLMRSGFSRRKVRVITAMASRLLALTEDGLDTSIFEEADAALHTAGVRW